jgi:hypothetical protein
MRMFKGIRNTKSVALPSELGCNSANRGIRGSAPSLEEIPRPHDDPAYIHCRANNRTNCVRPFRVAELILFCLSCAVLIGLLLLVGSLVNSWVQRVSDHVFDNSIWHEPLHSWTQ